MKDKKKTVTYSADEQQTSRVREVAYMPELGSSINLRAAKARLSALADLVEEGEEVVLTRDGKPVLRMVPFQAVRKPYKVNWELLQSMPMQTEAPFAEDLVREDRDGRGW
jgi:antitoxin (DNA-binding transcriptional repressor) of toxin-antitoxin stability system